MSQGRGGGRRADTAPSIPYGFLRYLPVRVDKPTNLDPRFNDNLLGPPLSATLHPDASRRLRAAEKAYDRFRDAVRDAVRENRMESESDEIDRAVKALVVSMRRVARHTNSEAPPEDEKTALRDAVEDAYRIASRLEGRTA